LRSKEYRDSLVTESLRSRLALQIRAMRGARNWKQKQLGERIGTKQEAISRLENPDYGKFTLETLAKLASAFDVALLVSFVPFSTLIDKIAYSTPQDFAVPSYEDDPNLIDHPESGTVVNIFRQKPPTTQIEGLKIDMTYGGTKRENVGG
jgi:transcriptional regulator with XRE-family HTH domain